MIDHQTSDSALLEALPVAVYTTDAQGWINWFNAAAALLWGQRPVLGETRWCGAWKLRRLDGKVLRAEDGALAQLLLRGRPARIDGIVERPDGSSMVCRPFPSALHDANGQLSGGVCAMVEVGQRPNELESARLAAIVSSSDDAIISKTLDGTITSWNAAAGRIFGYSAEEMLGQHITRLIPDELKSEEEHIIAKLRAGERIEHFDTVRMTKDGERLDVSLTISPIRDRNGIIVGASKTARDVTDRKRMEAVQLTLFDELNHRVKNTLATVQALAAQTLRGERSLDQARQIFQGRLAALSATHDQLSSNDWRAAPFGKVVEETLRPFAGAQIEIEGPLAMLSPRLAVAWSMVIHELATNAAKYGALSHGKGRVRIAWRLPEPGLLELDWTETGGPPATTPERKGFGTRFIERAAASDLAGTAHFDYRSEGLHVAIRARLD